jgi:hypothetical protein
MPTMTSPSLFWKYKGTMSYDKWFTTLSPQERLEECMYQWDKFYERKDDEGELGALP